MTSSITVAFKGTSSVLQASFLPEIMLDDDDYSCALLDLIIKVKDTSKRDEIFKLGEIRINCDIISNSYINGKQYRVIHQFTTFASTVKGSTLAEIPKHLNYFPVKVRSLQSIHISFVDHKGALVNIYDSEIICRINIKRN